MLRIGGYAHEVLQQSVKISNLFELFKILRATYGKDQRAIISSVKQLSLKSNNKKLLAKKIRNLNL